MSLYSSLHPDPNITNDDSSIELLLVNTHKMAGILSYLPLTKTNYATS